MPHICLVDDEQNIRRLVAYDLKQAGYTFDACENGLEAYTLSQSTKYDVFIVDWMMPVMDGLSLVKKLRAEGVGALIIMLTAKSEEEDLIEAFESGVDDYMTKPFSSRELLLRIKTHLTRLSQHRGQSLDLKGLTINPITREVKYQEHTIDLTKVEFDLLSYLAHHNDQVLSRDQILNELWGFDYDGDTRIVDVHISKLRPKLEVTSCRLKSLRGIGYRLEVNA